VGVIRGGAAVVVVAAVAVEVVGGRCDRNRSRNMKPL
jgi:hypothetical protein